MKARILKCLLILVVLCYGVPSSALEQYGTPLLSNFKPKDYNGGTQNWAVIQDQRGLLYVGNNVGVMEYDGASWRMIPTRNKAVVRSLALSPDGVIYVGSKGELGYLDSSHPAGTQYVSLLERIPADYRNFQDVRQTFATAQGVYFITRNAIFLMTQQQVKVWSTNSAFLKAFWVNNRLIVREEGTGLLELVQGAFSLLPGSEYFAQTSVFLLEQFNHDSLIVGSREGELFLLNSEGVTRWATEIDEALQQATLYTGMRLSSGDFALGTTQDGVFIVTPYGKLKSHINTELGLVDQNVRALYQDHQQGLWLALDHGLSRIDLASAISYYNSASGLQGNVLALHQHQNTLYAGTSLGLYRINHKNRFEAITSLQKQTWDFISYDTQLLVANNNGVYALQDNDTTLIRSSELASKVLYQSLQNPERVFVGLQDGLASMRYTQGKWIDEGRVPGVTGNLNSILETEAGELWLGSLAHGVFRLSLPPNWQGGNSVPLPVKRYTSHDGLPSNNRNSVHWYQNQLLVATVAGFYRPDADYQQFTLDNRLAAAFTGQQPWVRYPATDLNGNLWLLTWDNETGSRQAGVLFSDDSGAYRWQASALQPLQDIPLDTVLIDQQNVLWFGGAEGIFRFALDEHRSLPPKPPQIRQLRALEGDAFYTGGDLPARLALEAQHTNLRFEYASPNFSNVFLPQFQVKLQGHDTSWSSWSKELYRDYTNLPGGDYQFMVRSRDHAGNLLFSKPLSLHIAQHWYASIAAWLSYLLLLVLFIYAFIKWRMRHLLAEKQHLTILVEQRTAHLKHTMAQLHDAKQAAESAASAKSEFLANMSHELRTPLNAVLGFAELAQQDNAAAVQQQYLAKIRASGNILLSIINDILDFSKMDAGKLALENLPFSLRATLQQVTDMFSSQLQHKQLRYTLELADTVPDKLLGDALRLSQVLINLIANAIKFTEQGGITVSIRQLMSDEPSDHCLLEFAVTDTGIGISPEQQQQLFTAFSQADNSISRKYGGTGLGLTICQRLVNLMHGDLVLHSELGRGSTFSFAVRFAIANSAAPNSEHKAGALSAKPAGQPEPAPATNTQAGHYRILLVEDNYFNQALAQIILQRLGYIVVTATSGEQALQILQQQGVHLVLMDIEMPGINGYQTTQQLRAIPQFKTLPVIAMTAHQSDEVRQRCQQAGMDDLISKPIAADSLAQQLQQWLQR